jgi:hypothetical protein
MPKRKQRVAFRIIACTTAGRDVVFSCPEPTHKTFDTVAGFADKVHDLAVGDAKPSHIVVMHEHDFPRTVDSP